MELYELGKAILGSEAGPVALLLFFIAGITAWAYWQEKKKNEVVAEERLEEAERRLDASREEVELYVSTLNEATSAVREFKTTNEALRLGFDVLARAVTRQKGD